MQVNQYFLPHIYLYIYQFIEHTIPIKLESVKDPKQQLDNWNSLNQGIHPFHFLNEWSSSIILLDKPPPVKRIPENPSGRGSFLLV
ncbi:hypothetical protein AEM51_02730 [Bacteroidetes bacterium UKL13-3]|nr:hypothetical protein AEM51_02730 [Bacteroidetes bacterium UKL13-3]HCP93987.1 hypothetical protein [Bacteroidota bacterium]